MTDIQDGSLASSGEGAVLTLQEIYNELGVVTPSSEETLFATSAIKKAESAVRRYLGYNPVLASRTEFYPVMTPSYAGRESLWEVEGNQAILRQRQESSVNDLQLVHVPIRSITAPRLWIDYDGRFGTSANAFSTDTEKILGSDFWPVYDGLDDGGYKICRDGILKSFGMWPLEPGSIKVTYQAGYTADEFRGNLTLVDASPIFYSCLEEALRRFKKSYALWKKKLTLGHMATGSIQSENLGSYSYSLASSVSDSVMSSSDLTQESRERLSDFRNYGLISL